MILLIDGYNLFKTLLKKAELEKHEFNTLLSKLKHYTQKKQIATIIVFDGGELPKRYTERLGELTIIYAGTYKKADPLIIELLQEIKEETVLISSDNELVRSAEINHKHVIPPKLFDQLFNPPHVKAKPVALSKKPQRLPDNPPSPLDALMQEASGGYIQKHEEIPAKPTSRSEKLSKKEKNLQHLLQRLSL